MIERAVPTASLRTGGVRGRRAGPVDSYLGIPYAEAPVGELRFAPPVARSRWNGQWDATTATSVPQRARSGPLNPLGRVWGVQSSDCLRLNVWAPRGASGAAPVLFFVHGGAWVGGSPSNPLHDGASFARQGIVVVEAAYRLGAEGFLYLNDRFDDAQDTDNLGVRDLILALEWVQENIAAFGGDPTNVTLGGVSAGAMTVALLMSSPQADGLYVRAICESGASSGLTPDGAAEITEIVLQRLGAPVESVADLRRVPADTLLDVQGAVFAECFATRDPHRFGEAAKTGMPFQPVIGTELLPRETLAAIGRRSAAVPLLAGTASQEYDVLLAPLELELTAERIGQRLDGYVGNRWREEVLAFYRRRGLDRLALMAAVETDMLFRVPMLQLASTISETGADVFLYEFTWPANSASGRGTAHHFLELPFVFDTLAAAESLALTGPHPPAALAQSMRDSWTAFMTSGNPSTLGHEWPRYSERERAVQIFPGNAVQLDPYQQTRKLWARVTDQDTTVGAHATEGGQTDEHH